MSKLSLFILLITSTHIISKVNNSPELNFDKKECQIPSDIKECQFDDEDNIEFIFCDDNIVQCSFCDNLASFLMVDENELWGMCQECYFNVNMPDFVN